MGGRDGALDYATHGTARAIIHAIHRLGLRALRRRLGVFPWAGEESVPGQSATFSRRKRPGPLLATEAVRRWSAPMEERVTPSVVH